jgi:hypothetical protein
MRIISCDLHTAKHTIAMLDCDTGEVFVSSAVAHPTPGRSNLAHDDCWKVLRQIDFSGGTPRQTVLTPRSSCFGCELRADWGLLHAGV